MSKEAWDNAYIYIYPVSRYVILVPHYIKQDGTPREEAKDGDDKCCLYRSNYASFGK